VAGAGVLLDVMVRAASLQGPLLAVRAAQHQPSHNLRRDCQGRTAAAAACSLSGSGRTDDETMVRPWNGECVGYSDSSSFVLENPPAVDEGNAQQELQDERMKYDEE